jgi:hypothetical protein
MDFVPGAWHEEVMSVEKQISRLRARQVDLLRFLDRYQIDTADGARTMGDWVAAQLDLSHQTASRLMTVANAQDPEVDHALATGKWGLDGAAVLVKLRRTGATPQLFTEAAERYSLGSLYGLVDKLRHLSPADEQDLFEYRYLVVQPNLDQSAFKLWGQLPSSTGREARGRWRKSPKCSSMPTWRPNRSGETGATVSSGPRVGPNNLSEILCTGKIRVIVTDGHMPISYSDLGEAIHQMGFKIDPSSPTHRRQLIGPKTTTGPPLDVYASNGPDVGISLQSLPRKS